MSEPTPPTPKVTLDNLLSVDFAVITVERLVEDAHFPHIRPALIPFPFAVFGTGIVLYQWKIFQFPEDIKTDKVIEAMHAEGFDQADAAPALAFCSKFPDAWHEGPIVCLGARNKIQSLKDDQAMVIGGIALDATIEHDSPLTQEDSNIRGLGCMTFNRTWKPHNRFLAMQVTAQMN